ncbi:histidine phosphatase family protein [Myxococcota bacterium]|nr:histidine phosphatase family protein [Myxococcota bacterium]
MAGRWNARHVNQDSTELLLIRHGESTWNELGLWQGHEDVPLSTRGRSQVNTLATEIADERVDVLISSDLRRAMETARILGRALGLDPMAEPALRELDLGEWSGLDRSQIAARWPDLLQVFDGGDPEARPAGGETRSELAVRVRGAVSKIVEEHSGLRVALVAHFGVIEALLPDVWLENAELRRAKASQLRL